MSDEAAARLRIARIKDYLEAGLEMVENMAEDLAFLREHYGLDRYEVLELYQIIGYLPRRKEIEAILAVLNTREPTGS